MAFEIQRRRQTASACAQAAASWLVWLSVALAARAESNINPTNSFCWGANIGWINWRPDAQNGGQVGEFICSGFLYSANVGWIHLGNGNPANGARYQNDSATDFGVNVDSDGNLRGFAYGANIGWVSFESVGAPKVDPRTGKLSGQVYSANTGWLSLSDAAFFVQVDSFTTGTDSDGDGIPDAWELAYANDLSVLTASGDHDGDGQTDFQEYLADTNPNDPTDHLSILRLSVSADLRASEITWKSRPSRNYRIQSRTQFSPGAPWAESGLGLQAPDGTLTMRRITNSPGTRLQFFRIQAERPLAQ